MWAEGANVNGLLGFLLSGSGTSTNGVAELTRYGIVRFQTPASNSYASWTMRMPLRWENINYFEIGFRGWAINTSTNTTLGIGMYDDRTSTTADGIYIQYSTNQTPTNIWNMRVNGVTAGTFSAPLASQLINTWLKIRITNTSDTGSWSATFTNQVTNDTQTITGTGITIGSGGQYFIGGIVTCVSGSAVKVCDMDYCMLQLK